MKNNSPGRSALRALIVVTTLVAACHTSPASPSDSTEPPSRYVVKIALVGMDPVSIEVPVGAAVTFVNNDKHFPHHMGSACSEFDALGRLEPSQSGDTDPFTASKTCSYYDRLYPENPLRHGKIVVRQKS